MKIINSPCLVGMEFFRPCRILQNFMEVKILSEAIIAAKAKFVEAFAEELKSAKSIVVINYLGLTVDEVTAFRAELRESNAKMKVVKNTYLRRAAAIAGLDDLAPVFVGPTAVIYTDDEDNVTAPARIAADYAKKFDVVEIKGGALEGQVATKEQVEELAAIPGREGLLSMLLSVLQAPVRNFAYVVKAVAESKEESAE